MYVPYYYKIILCKEFAKQLDVHGEEHGISHLK